MIFLSVLLTNLLSNDLKRSSPSRIVIVSSKLHDPKTKFGKPLHFKWTLDGMTDYKNSELANIWFAYELV